MTATDAHVRRLTRARAAVFGLFASFGLVVATWAAHLPSVKSATDSSASMVGLLLLLLGGGAVAGMQLSGMLVDRIGAVWVAVAGVAAMAISLWIPLAVHTWPSAAAGAVALGVATGAGEVGINAAAVDVERAYARPIMAAFHAVFSLGNVCGAGIAAAGFALHVGAVVTALIVGAVALAVVGVAAVILLRTPAADHQGATLESGVAEPDSPHPTKWRRVLVLCVLAFTLLLAEGSAMDWSSLHAQDHLGGSPTAGALALGCFVTAMTAGRFTADRIVERAGSVSVLRWGAALAIAGLILVTTSPLLPLTCAGWTLLGLGLAGGLPSVITAAGNLGGASGKALSRVVGCGYLAILAGPGLIGWLADHIGLDAALLLPAATLAFCVVAAGAVART